MPSGPGPSGPPYHVAVPVYQESCCCDNALLGLDVSLRKIDADAPGTRQNAAMQNADAFIARWLVVIIVRSGAKEM